MKIRFYVHSSHGDAILDPEYCENHPLGGSETAAVRLAGSLKKLGMDAQVITDFNQLATLRCDVFVALRTWEVFAPGVRPGRLNYLWCQDDVDQQLVVPLKDPEIARRVYDACDGVIMISHYQANRWLANLHVPPEKIFMSSNGIDLERFPYRASRTTGRPAHAYYASTPFRGLKPLLDLWPEVYGALGDRARLTICSSLKVYGTSDEAAYEPLYEQARQTKGVVYLGSVGQRQLREVAVSNRALAYPCTFPETGCIAAMEAMAAGCAVVSTALGVLPETAWRNPLVAPTDGWADLWLEELIRVLVDDEYYRELAEANLHLAKLMGWDSVARRWLMRFRSDGIKRTANHAMSSLERIGA